MIRRQVEKRRQTNKQTDEGMKGQINMHKRQKRSKETVEAPQGYMKRQTDRKRHIKRRKSR